MFVLIVGAGKVGLNVARSLARLGHEFLVVEQRRRRFDLLRPELEDQLLFGDGTEMWVLEEAGITRADLVVAVTGDDEDNVVIAQLAKHEYHVPKVVARVNDPRNRPTFDLLDVDATICASTMVVSMIQHELPVAPVRAAALPQAREHGGRRDRGERRLAGGAAPPARGAPARRGPRRDRAARRGRHRRQSGRPCWSPATTCSACCRRARRRRSSARSCPAPGPRTSRRRAASTSRRSCDRPGSRTQGGAR